VNWLLSIIAALFRWLANRSEPAAVARRDREELEATKQEIAREVKSHDKDAVNARMQDLLKVVAVLMVVTCAGCVSKPYPVYADKSQEMVPMSFDGRQGWFVPDALEIEIEKKLAERQMLLKQGAK
jgi:hypothetical protein